MWNNQKFVHLMVICHYDDIDNNRNYCNITSTVTSLMQISTTLQGTVREL